MNNKKLISIAITGLAVMTLAGCSSNENSKSSSTQTAKKTVVEKNTAKAVTLTAGSHKVGKEIKPGRYIIKAMSGNGNLFSSHSPNDRDINVILGTTEDDTWMRLPSYTTDLIKGEKIKLDGIESTKLTPTSDQRTFRTTLTAGSWTVGKDIEPGDYIIKATRGTGNIFSDNADDDINEILAKHPQKSYGQVSKLSAELTKGEIITSDVPKIKLIKN
ncbi:hypothetical protein [Lactobacillus sp. ESL0677]|uniref:hypothetical protein n=1 Tax=Lactobacillus sp. ESL0677 TaxID=2983208 RepID=UPI0023F72A79|nr:hypothetical protein [Lactobacillus sp. ESL0677]WEV37692.1 hypothetical protein OZX76_03835 [Lactobacillus sp. ESL0677]